MKRLLALVIAAGILAAWTAAGVAGSAATQPTGDGTLVNDEVVLAQLDPTGLPIQADLISRVSSQGGEPHTVFDPTATANVEYLNQRGRPEVTGDGVDLEVGGDQPQVYVLKALVDQPLPVALHAEYTLDGQVVDPTQVVNATGRLRIRYTVTNTDVKRQTITYTDATGKEHSEKQPVFAPFVGTLTTTLPSSFEVTDPKKAILSTDQDGNTVLLWNLLLYPPMGSYQQTVAFEADVNPGSIPQTVLNAVPVSAEQDPATAFTDTLLEKSVDGNEQLAAGLDQLNNSTLQLAQGTRQLSNGIVELATGTEKINEGVAAGLVPGTQGIASGSAALAGGQAALTQALGAAAVGAGQLTTGTQGLASGLDTLAAGLRTFSDTGMPALASGAAALESGAEQLADAVGSPDDPPLPAPSPSLPLPPTPIPTPSGSPVFPTPTASPTQTPTLVQAVNATLRGTIVLRQQLVTLNNNLLGLLRTLADTSTDATEAARASAAAAGTLDALYPTVCPGTLTPEQCARLSSARDDAKRAAAAGRRTVRGLGTSLRAAAIESLRAYGLAFGSNALVEALTGIHLGVDRVAVALRSGSSKPGQEGLVEGLAQLSAGLDQATQAAQQLTVGAEAASAGATKLATGNSQLATGLGQATAGSAKLATGGRELAAGAGELAFGTQQVSVALGQLAVGAGAAAKGSGQLAEGAAKLQEEGTSQIYESVVKSSSQPALASAYLKASNERAATALPYGLPEGATGSAAYVMTMAPVVPVDNTPWQAAALGLLILATAGGAVLKQLQSHRTAAAS